jgi:hypothetical protein
MGRHVERYTAKTCRIRLRRAPTVDKNLQYQQPIHKFDIALVVVPETETRLPHLEGLRRGLGKALAQPAPGTVIRVLVEP